MPERRKVAVFQLDSLDLELLRKSRSQLPVLDRLLGANGLTELETEPFAGSTAASFNTARRPGDHGVYFQLQWDPGAMRLRSLDPGWIGDLTPFWRTGPLASLRGILLDPNFCFAGASPQHLEVLGWSAHSSLEPFQCSLPEEATRIAATYGKNPIGHEDQVDRGMAERSAERDRMIASAQLRGRLLCDLLGRQDWDFLYAVFGEPHRAGHVLWPLAGVTPEDGLLSVLRAVDDALGEVVRALPERTEIVLFSAQGMSHQSSQSHFCRPLLEAALTMMGEDPGTSSGRPGFVAWLRRQVPDSLQWKIRQRIPLRVRDRIVAREYGAGIRPGETIAFPLRSDNHGYWRMMIEGREARGTLSQVEAGTFAEDFADIIHGFRTPEGAPLVTGVHFPSRGSGARAHLLPDIVAAWNPDIGQAKTIFHPKFGEIRAVPDAARTGNHRFRAFYCHVGQPPGQRPLPTHVSDLPGLIEHLATGASDR